MISKGWVIEGEGEISIHFKKPDNKEAYEAIIKIIPIERDEEEVFNKVKSNLDKMAKESENIKKFASEMKKVSEAMARSIRENKR